MDNFKVGWNWDKDKNNLIGPKVRENAGFIDSELVVGSKEKICVLQFD